MDFFIFKRLLANFKKQYTDMHSDYFVDIFDNVKKEIGGMISKSFLLKIRLCLQLLQIRGKFR